MGRFDIAADFVDKRIRLFGIWSDPISRDEHHLLRRINRRLEFLFGLSGQVKHHAFLAVCIFFVAQTGTHGYIERPGDSNGLAV